MPLPLPCLTPLMLAIYEGSLQSPLLPSCGECAPSTIATVVIAPTSTFVYHSGAELILSIAILFFYCALVIFMWPYCYIIVVISTYHIEKLADTYALVIMVSPLLLPQASIFTPIIGLSQGLFLGTLLAFFEWTDYYKALQRYIDKSIEIQAWQIHF